MVKREEEQEQKTSERMTPAEMAAALERMQDEINLENKVRMSPKMQEEKDAKIEAKREAARAMRDARRAAKA